MRLVCLGRTRSLLAAAAVLLLARPTLAQQAATTGALERFQPSVAGDALFGVASPGVSGHLVPRAKAVVDFGLLPLSVEENGTRSAIVSQQTYLHLNASLALWDRLLVSLDMPFALAQGGDNPTVAGVSFASPQSAEVGDLRLGARVRLFGEERGAFQVGLNGYLYAPTGPDGSYAADGAVRGEPQLVMGGRVDRLLYAVSVGTTLRASARPHTFDARAGAAVVFGKDFLQLGPELTLSTPFSNEILVDTDTTRIETASPVSAELLLGAKLRPLPFLVVGAAAGPGLTQGYGTPVFFAVGSIGYEPLASSPPAKAKDKDTDGDGISDKPDACPQVKGPKSDDPRKNGCPKDPDPRRDEQSKNAAPPEPAPAPEPDRDADAIPDKTDACPDEPGKPDEDPKQNGCPQVAVTRTEIVILRQVRFRFGQSSLYQTVDPVSDDLLTEVRDAIVSHPEIELIEIQGHADNMGPEGINQELSDSRAASVRAWLVKRGIPPEKLVAKGYGAGAPVASNDSKQGRQQNRRVQFMIIKKKEP